MGIRDLSHRKKADASAESATRVHVNVSMHFTVWCSLGDFESQMAKNVKIFQAMFEELRHWPGAGINLHFEVFDFQVFEKHAPIVMDLIAECLENGAIELMKGGLVDYGAIITPLEDLEKHHRLWDEYVRTRFGINTEGLFIWPNEMQYHPNMPRIWKRCGISGIILSPYHPLLRRHQCEPLELVGEDGCSSIVIASINEDTKLMNYARGIFSGVTLDESTLDSVYDTILTKGSEYARESGFTDPIIAYAHDLTNFQPATLGKLLGLIQDTADVSTTSLARYAKLVKPIRKVYLDQGNWDTFYEWARSSEGWFTQQQWHLHMNGLSYYAHRRLHEVEGLAAILGSDLGLSQDIEAAEKEMLLSERTTSRAHWAHPEPRRWAQDRALNSINGSHTVLGKMGEALVSRIAAAGDGSLLDFALVNPSERTWKGMYYAELAAHDGTGLDNLSLVGQANEPVSCQFMASAGGRGGTLVFPAVLPPRSAMSYSLRNGEPAPQEEKSKLAVSPLGDKKIVLESDLVEVVLDLRNGGCIDSYRHKGGGRTILSRGNVFAGTVYMGRDADGRECQDAVITDVGRPATWEVIAQGPLVAGVRVCAEMTPGLATRFSEYYLEQGSRHLWVRTGTRFLHPIWFAPEYDACARVIFEPALGAAQMVQWRMPGGALRPREVPEEWSGFDTLGWVHIYDHASGLAILPRLYPNGPRMVCLKKGIISLAVSGMPRIDPYYISGASLGSQTYELLFIPTDGTADELEEAYGNINKAPMVLYDDRRHPAVLLKRPAEEPVPYPESHLSEEVYK